ncbi:STM4504/CBY_0614 family protein [Nostoc sp.]|uniref:STM4504/CBY_0614 family protein n=1 Tax=Nostoc sp. TaxID=1180 RepID=UPI002FFBB36A
MNVFDIYSKRQKRFMGEVPDVYQYENIPSSLRVQIVYIMNDALGDHENNKTIENFKFIHDTLCREYGKFSLIEKEFFDYENYIGDVINFIIQCNNTNHILDVVELSFRLIDTFYRQNNIKYLCKPKITPDAAIEELNFRFREHGVGYQYESGEIIRVDSQIIHTEAVKPVLLLLSDTRFKGANEEFLKAHEHYRHGRYKECLVECLKAFESTMKTICDIRGWIYQPGDSAKNLINLCLQNNLIPTYLQTQVTSLKSSLESGVPTMRNKNAGHGQGSQPLTVPQYFAAYQLHMTASTILFLLEAEKALP